MTQTTSDHGSTTSEDLQLPESPKTLVEASNTDPDPDPDPRPDEPVRGWPRVAKLLAETPDFAAFPRFRDLNIKSLLYYQAQLDKLREDLDVLERKDAYDGDEKVQEYANDVSYLINESPRRNHKQWKLILEMRRLLKEYNKALLQYTKLSQLPDPDDYNVEALRVWLKRDNGGQYCIGGPGAKAWGDLYKRERDKKSLWSQFFHALLRIFWQGEPSARRPDLVATRKPSNVDGLTRWVASEFVPFYQECKNKMEKTEAKDEEKNSPENSEDRGCKQAFGTLEKYSENRILIFTSSVATLIACLLPTAAIAVLSTVHDTRNRILYIGAFTAIFAVGLMFLTNAATSRVQIFSATAAFSAVLVVFVQNA